VTMADINSDSADESLRELVDVFERQIIQHLSEPSRLFPYLDLTLIPLRKLCSAIRKQHTA